MTSFRVQFQLLSSGVINDRRKVITLVVHPMSTYGQEIVASGQSVSLWVSLYRKEKIYLEDQYFNEMPR